MREDRTRLPQIMAAIAAFAPLASCTERPQPMVRVAEVCLDGNEDYEDVVKTISIVADRYDLVYYNSSVETASSYAYFKSQDDAFTYVEPVVNVAFRGDIGVDVTAGNLLPRDRVLVLGFAYKNATSVPHPVEREVIAELSKDWLVVQLGDGVGATGRQCA